MPFTYQGTVYETVQRPQAARFLAHATMGYATSDVSALRFDGQGYWGWLDKQFQPIDAKPAVGSSNASSTYELAGMDHYTWLVGKYGSVADAGVDPVNFKASLDGVNAFGFSPTPFVSSFVRKVIHSEEKLRLKTAYALSQILVVSGTNGLDDTTVYLKVGGYFDILADKAFTTYEDLLLDISGNLIMGEYLTFLGSKKKSGDVRPDENYAREIMQLFTIGPVALDTATGEPVIDVTKTGSNVAAPIYQESYVTAHVEEAAKVFTGRIRRGTTYQYYRGVTGWDPISQATKTGNAGVLSQVADHDDGAINITFPIYTNGVAGTYSLSTAQNLSMLDQLKKFIHDLVRHPNTAYYISRLLIQQFTTSNPSIDYVQRVAAAFRSEVNGMYGDMRAVIKAILMDPSLFTSNASGQLVRSNVPDGAGFGKLVEPFLRFTHMLKALDAKDVSPSRKFGLCTASDEIFTSTSLGQAPMCAPSVFNFYRPGFVAPNRNFSTNLRSTIVGGVTYTTPFVAPALQITTGSSLQSYADFMAEALNPNKTIGSNKYVVIDYAGWEMYNSQLSDEMNVDILINGLSDALCRSVLAASTKSTIKNVLLSMSYATSSDLKQRAQVAAFLITISPEYMVHQ